MSAVVFVEIREQAEITQELDNEFQDAEIRCIDCMQKFVWTAGEQLFFRDKKLLNPPKRCKGCKRRKNERLAIIENGSCNGKRPRIEVTAKCAKCEVVTTVPFYPSQGRPVYCRACFLEITACPNNNSDTAN